MEEKTPLSDIFIWHMIDEVMDDKINERKMRQL